jgi:hypothetical protein
VADGSVPCVRRAVTVRCPRGAPKPEGRLLQEWAGAAVTFVEETPRRRETGR